MVKSGLDIALYRIEIDQKNAEHETAIYSYY